MSTENKEFISEEVKEIKEKDVMVTEEVFSDDSWGSDIAFMEDIISEEDDTENSSNEKRQNFQRLAEARITKILKSISVLGNLSNRSSYEYSDEQVEEMFSAIEKVLAEIRRKFTSKKKETKFSFKR